ncbi:MAG: laccase domain-containing protein, partial [Chloroflexota bacterium]
GLLIGDPAPGAARRLDLWEANRRLLAGAGVLDRRITVVARCTACRADQFFSHRAQQGQAGRLAAVIALAANRR